jgi:hypothetical protein
MPGYQFGKCPLITARRKVAEQLSIGKNNRHNNEYTAVISENGQILRGNDGVGEWLGGF